MPELPEVETTRRGIARLVTGHEVTKVIVRQRQLRWPVPRTLAASLTGQKIHGISRRAKYLLFEVGDGVMLLHLGMSGSLRVLDSNMPAEPHDHVDIVLDNGCCLRFRDPRRFGSIHWTVCDPNRHRLLKHLGVEPLSEEFNGDYLYGHAFGRRAAVKTFIMDGRIVVGVGNIYASEALFESGIHPLRSTGRISVRRYHALSEAIKNTLTKAIKAGGTTLRDFYNSEGEPGYFTQCLQVYGRAGEGCNRCGGIILTQVIGQRSTFYCPKCQH